MLQCGTIDDVYSYEKMKHQRGNESPQSARLSCKKTLESVPQSPTSAKLGSKKTSSFRWISRQSDGALGSSKRVGTQDAKESSVSSISTSFYESVPQSPTSAKLGGKKTSSFRWISRQSDGALGSSKRVGTQDAKESSVSSLSTSKKPKDPSKRIGFIDILLGYHSLLQASPAYPGARQRKEFYPTVGFIRNPDYGT